LKKEKLSLISHQRMLCYSDGGGGGWIGIIDIGLGNNKKKKIGYD
jgi:hypothetical protein